MSFKLEEKELLQILFGATPFVHLVHTLIHTNCGKYRGQDDDYKMMFSNPICFLLCLPCTYIPHIHTRTRINYCKKICLRHCVFEIIEKFIKRITVD